jgi:excisionase family DNA binding protein
MANKTVTVNEAATHLGVSENVVRKAIRAGHLSATPRGAGVRTGYLIPVGALSRWAQSRNTRIERVTSEACEFVEEATPLFPDLPMPKLPPARGTASELIDYAATCQKLAETALSMARRRMTSEGER